MTDSKSVIPKDLTIGLERTMCPVASPDYSILVYGNGKIVYEGQHYVAVKGRRKGRILEAHVNQLGRILQDRLFFA